FRLNKEPRPSASVARRSIRRASQSGRGSLRAYNMARVAFFNLPAYGHINPTLPVVAELVRRGESVVYYSNEEFRDVIEKTGARFCKYHPPIDENAGQAASNSVLLAALLLETSAGLLPNLLQDIENDPVDY